MGPLQAALAKPLTLCAAAASCRASWSETRRGKDRASPGGRYSAPLRVLRRGGGEADEAWLFPAWLSHQPFVHEQLLERQVPTRRQATLAERLLVTGSLQWRLSSSPDL